MEPRSPPVQVATITGTPTGGTFALSSGGNTATLAYNAAAATVQTAIRAWSGIYSTVTVTGSAGGPYTITFPLNGAPITASGALLTGGTSPAAVVAQTDAAATSLGINLSAPGATVRNALAAYAARTVTARWSRLGFPVAQLPEVVVTPTCGLAGASPAYARAVLAACREAGRRLHEAPEPPES